MSPSTTTKGPSATTKGDTLPFNQYTIMGSGLTPRQYLQWTHPKLHQTILTPVEDVNGCQDHLDTSVHTPYMSVILPNLTEFRQPLQVQSHLEMPGILVQLGHIQRT